ncbi:MAG: apolipoprotein N-acyltransferase [Treponema sp.]|jgi:apolipoprotein N-acyltransferase|nr:apolipoprotein N-acyltransferase [Treponema sp.]
MIYKQRRGWIKNIFINLGLILLGVLLFAGAFPNLLVEKGLPLFAWVAYIPVFILIRRISLGTSAIWGALYGYSAYGLFNYWLSVFHPLAGLIVGLIYLVYLAVLFFFLKLADVLFRRRAWLVQWVIWIAYEYLRTQGFLGYSYGITGYSQWTLIPVIQIADTLGVWGVSALVVFPSAWFAQAFWDAPRNPAGARGFAGYAGALRNFFLKEKISSLAWAAAFCAALVYGFIAQVDYSASPSARIALVQHNTDPWRGGIEEYRRNYQVLRRLSDEALRADPKPDLVVWSETAFVPRIYWHTTYRDDPPSWALVKELLDYLRLQDVPFLIGNDDARKDPSKNPRDDYRIDYNAVMLFERGDLTALYRKLHLVPFTEHFPYEKQFPWIYQALKNADTHFWEKGAEAVVFSLPEFSFSSPICFEDTFGYLSRKFVRHGAEIIVNLSNDAWSKSLPAQNQHLSMAVFRAVENRRSMARSTASGQTCAVDPNGRITAMAPPFTESWITVEVPVMKGTTLYTRYGDFLAWVFTAAAGALLILGFVCHILKVAKKIPSAE